MLPRYSVYSAVSNCTSFHLPVSVAKISAISCNYYKKRPINRGPQTSPYSYFTPITTPLLHTHTHTHTHTLRTPLFHAPIISHRVVLLKENKEKCLLQKIFQKRFFEWMVATYSNSSWRINPLLNLVQQAAPLKYL